MYGHWCVLLGLLLLFPTGPITSGESSTVVGLMYLSVCLSGPVSHIYICRHIVHKRLKTFSDFHAQIHADLSMKNKIAKKLQTSPEPGQECQENK